jgi:hypothetical protein
VPRQEGPPVEKKAARRPGMDAIDAVFHSWQVANPDAKASISKVKEGIYIVDDGAASQKIICQIRGSSVMVRRGGGYMNLMDFLDDWVLHHQS